MKHFFDLICRTEFVEIQATYGSVIKYFKYTREKSESENNVFKICAGAFGL